MENLIQLRNFIIQSVEKIIDPQSEIVFIELFVIKQFLSRIPNHPEYLQFIKDGFEALKNSSKYNIVAEQTDLNFGQINEFMNKETEEIGNKRGKKVLELKNWN